MDCERKIAERKQPAAFERLWLSVPWREIPLTQIPSYLPTTRTLLNTTFLIPPPTPCQVGAHHCTQCITHTTHSHKIDKMRAECNVQQATYGGGLWSSASLWLTLGFEVLGWLILDLRFIIILKIFLYKDVLLSNLWALLKEAGKDSPSTLVSFFGVVWFIQKGGLQAVLCLLYFLCIRHISSYISYLIWGAIPFVCAFINQMKKAFGLGSKLEIFISVGWGWCAILPKYTSYDIEEWLEWEQLPKIFNYLEYNFNVYSCFLKNIIWLCLCYGWFLLIVFCCASRDKGLCWLTLMWQVLCWWPTFVWFF